MFISTIKPIAAFVVVYGLLSQKEGRFILSFAGIYIALCCIMTEAIECGTG